MINKANCCTNPTDMKGSFKIAQPVPDSDCSCGCNPNESEEQAGINNQEVMHINIDGNPLTVYDSSKNIVELAKEAGVSIPAPCYLAKRKNGCCNSCVVEIDGKQAYACGTKPINGMKIIVNRPDLKVLRRNRLQAYAEGIKTGKMNPCCR